VVLGDYNIDEEGETETVIANAKEFHLHPGRILEFYQIDPYLMINFRLLHDCIE
jgi:hypothetical protein